MCITTQVIRTYDVISSTHSTTSQSVFKSRVRAGEKSLTRGNGNFLATGFGNTDYENLASCITFDRRKV